MFLAFLVGLVACSAPAQSNTVPIEARRWFEVRSAHFYIYSCAAPQDVRELATHLEQFCEAFSLMAGAQAVASPPVIVVAFPDQETMRPFLPLYHGKPGNLAGFFKRGSDENLIVLALPGADSAFDRMEVIFHEYAHLLFRRNSEIWPLWLNEGMAEIYSTFESSGYVVRVGRPMAPYVDLLNRQPMMPLRELFAVTHDSPQYNESDRQGMFYAESWLLIHFLVAGGDIAAQARLGRFTTLLREGQPAEEAFTNALRTSLPAMEIQLRAYLDRGNFEPLQWALPMNLSVPAATTIRVITPVETYFQLGDELLHIERLDEAGSCFSRAQKLAPASSLPYAGLGLLDARRDDHAEAVKQFTEAMQRGPVSFLAHYIYAREKYRLTADSSERYKRLAGPEADEIRAELTKSIMLMPSFAPAHELMGFFETVQGQNYYLAEQQLELAIQLEPDNASYLLSLAQAQQMNREPDAARKVLQPLLLPNADAKLRRRAEEMIREGGREQSGR